MDEIYKIIEKISDRTYRECLKNSFDTFHRVTNEGIRFSEGCVFMMCVYGEMAGYLTSLESAYIKGYIEDKADFDFERYQQFKK